MSKKSEKNIFKILNLKPFQEFYIDDDYVNKYRFLENGTREKFGLLSKSWYTYYNEEQLLKIINNPDLIIRMMTLDDAIDHAKKVAKNGDCKECRMQHQQLAEWLEELKKLRKSVNKDSEDG